MNKPVKKQERFSKTSLSRSRSKSKSPIKNKQIEDFQTNQSPLQKWKKTMAYLPRREESAKIPHTKAIIDQKNQYKYKDQILDFYKRSNLTDVQRFLANMITKSRTKTLSNTQKFMLAGYIDVYIKQNFSTIEIKENATLTVQKLKNEWTRLSQAWTLYKIKQQRCQIGNEWQEKQQRITQNFELLQQEIKKIDKKNQKLQPIRKLMKKFYIQLVS